MMSDQQLHNEPIVVVPWVPPKSTTWEDILRPVTIFQLLQAESSPFFEDKSLVIEGRGFARVTFVAHAVTVDINAASVCCTLEDGTGRIKAYKDFDSLTKGGGSSAEAEKEEKDQYKTLEQTYVEVLGTPKKDKLDRTYLLLNSIHPVHGYHHILHHTLNVIHTHILTDKHIQPYNFDEPEDFVSNDHDMEIYTPVDNDQAYQDDISMQHHITDAIPASPSPSPVILPNTFSPQKHQPYATLQPLERAIMKYMSHHRNCQVSIAELAQAIPVSCGCTELQFNVAVQELLLEAYITNPLDDGYVVITPRC